MCCKINCVIEFIYFFNFFRTKQALGVWPDASETRPRRYVCPPPLLPPPLWSLAITWCGHQPPATSRLRVWYVRRGRASDTRRRRRRSACSSPAEQAICRLRQPMTRLTNTTRTPTRTLSPVLSCTIIA
jgi:hypothetical protein